MEARKVSGLSPRMLQGVREFARPFQEQYQSFVWRLVELTEVYPIALCAVFGSMVKGLGPGSDIDILVLMRDEYKQKYDLLDLKEDIYDDLWEHRVNNISLDLVVRSVSGFLDTSRGTEFKRSFCEANIVFWEDSVTIDRRFIKTTEAV